MNRSNFIFILGLGLGSSIACWGQELPALNALLQQHGLKRSQVSIEFRQVKADGQVQSLLSFDPDLPLNPASTMKVLTTAAALKTLGPSYRFKTEIYTQGALQAGRLRGNLYVKGFGDPSMVSELLWRLVTDLHNRGLQTIDGDLIGDDSYLEKTSWRPQFDAGISSNSGNGALSLNYNHLQIWLQPSTVGAATRVVLDPDLSGYLKLNNQTLTVAGGVNQLQVDLVPSATTLGLRAKGQLGVKQSPVLVYRSLPDPSRYYLEAFRALFESSGGKITGKVRVGLVPGAARMFYKKESEAYLSQVLILLNKYSNNFIAEQLVMLMGAMQQPGSGSHQRGLAVIQQLLQEMQATHPQSVIASGSGMSKENRLSARQLAQVLAEAEHAPGMGPEMQASLSIFGEDGTTKRRPDAKTLGAYVRAKTGSINNVVALAGYIYRNHQTVQAPISFAILIEKPGAVIGTYRQLQNDIIDLAIQQSLSR